MNKEKASLKLVMLNRIMFVLSILGMIMAVYVLQSWLRHTGIICITGGGCETVRKNIVSYPFGIPVPAIGLAGYTILTMLAFMRTTSKTKWLLNAMLGMTIFGVCFVTWFTSMEIFVIKGICTWCAVSAVNMYVIFALVLRSKLLEKKIK